MGRKNITELFMGRDGEDYSVREGKGRRGLTCRQKGNRSFIDIIGTAEHEKKGETKPGQQRETSVTPRNINDITPSI